MLLPKFASILILSIFTISSARAQQADTTKIPAPGLINLPLTDSSPKAKPAAGWSRKSWVVPVGLIAYGAASIGNKGLSDFNFEIKEEVYLENPHKKFPLDNYLQYAPAAAVYGLNAMGIKGRNNFRDRTGIYLLSNLILSSTVLSVKKISHELRPDGSDYFSFPSGHTAEAFASAEFLRQEYKNVSAWYGIAGYVVAATTGFLRMYNNKHWMSDVAAGAGVGIASTRIAYWLYPLVQHKFLKHKAANTVLLPTYHAGVLGLEMVHRFI